MFVEGGACATAQWHNGQSKPDDDDRDKTVFHNTTADLQDQDQDQDHSVQDQDRFFLV